MLRDAGGTGCFLRHANALSRKRGNMQALRLDTSDMTPTEFAGKAHQAVPLFRDQHDGVNRQVAGVSSGHEMSLGAVELDFTVPTGEAEELPATSPADLGDQFLTALFGAWPAGDSGRIDERTKRELGVDISEVPWEDWERESRL